MANSVEVDIKLELQEATKAIQSLTKQIDQFGKSAEDSSKRAGSAFQVLKGVLGAEAIIKGFSLATDAAKAFFGAIKDEGIGAAIAQEQAVIDLSNSLNLAGKNAKAIVPEFVKFADSLEQTTNIADDVILSNVALLQSLAPLTERGLKEATTAAIDLSKKFKVDLTTAIKAVGSAANGNVSLLERLTKKQFEQGIDNADTFAKALQNLGKISGGAAEELAQGFEGRLTNTQNAIGNFLESFGKIIIENDAVKAAITAVGETFIGFQKIVEDNADEINNFITNSINFLKKSFETISNVIKTTSDIFMEWADDVAIAASIVVTPILLVAGAIGALVIALNIGTIAASAFAAVMAVVTSPITLVVAGFAALVVAVKLIKDNFDLIVGTLKAFAGNVLQVVAPAIQFLADTFLFIPKTILKIVESLDSLPASWRKFIPDSVISGAKTLKDGIDNIGKSVEEFGKKIEAEGERQKELSQQNIDNKNKEVMAVQEAEKSKQDAVAKTTEQELLELEKRLSLFALFNEAKKQQQEQFEQVRREVAEANSQAEIDALTNNLSKQQALEELNNIRKLQAEGKLLEAKKAILDLDKKNQEASATYTKKFDEMTAKEKIDSYKERLGIISGLQSESNAELFAIGKAAALANAIIYGHEAVAKAWAVGGPFGAPLAIAVTIATAANIARIANAQPPKRQAGGILPGVVSPTDTTLFQGAPGELILNRRQQTNLFNAINQDQIGGGGGGVTVNISGNVIADDDSQVQNLIERINDNIRFRNAAFV